MSNLHWEIEDYPPICQEGCSQNREGQRSHCQPMQRGTCTKAFKCPKTKTWPLNTKGPLKHGKFKTKQCNSKTIKATKEKDREEWDLLRSYCKESVLWHLVLVQSTKNWNDAIVYVVLKPCLGDFQKKSVRIIRQILPWICIAWPLPIISGDLQETYESLHTDHSTFPPKS